jgi:hypothetical protein
MEGNLAFLTYDVRGDNDHFETMIRLNMPRLPGDEPPCNRRVAHPRAIPPMPDANRKTPPRGQNAESAPSGGIGASHSERS